ncbi:T3SS regulon anti-activator ExsD domain-containing protein [Proteus vulgaris]|uniref:T3SS regulon anti-activator ExsD domain-containing protein n=1 Tax=Proteus vulgaris TaxID=585 RepID=UPI000657A7F8|nr:T3SS regulon anti-activator ExsD domain-containing protein [Proteus vulgaris]CRL62044.1 hypothetical protein BN1805_01556 [Proteus vulgaris]
MIKEHTNNSKVHYYSYLDLLKKMMVNENKKTVDDLFNLQFSLFFSENNINERQIKILSRILCRENLDSLLQSTWFLRKKHCSVSMTKNDIHRIVDLARSSQLKTPHALFTACDWDHNLNATININEHLRLIQAVIKPLFIWWVDRVSPQIFTLYKAKRELGSQIKQCENIKSFEKKQPSNNSDSFLSLDKIKEKQELYVSKLLENERLLNKEIQLLIENWKNEPIFNVEINNTLDYIQNVTPHSELLKPLWAILKTIPNQPKNCLVLKEWLLERELCLKNDEFLWQ